MLPLIADVDSFYQTPTAFGIPVGGLIFILLIVKMMKGSPTREPYREDYRTTVDRQIAEARRLPPPNVPLLEDFRTRAELELENEKGGARVVQLLNETSERTKLPIYDIAELVFSKTGIQLSIRNDQLNVTDDELNEWRIRGSVKEIEVVCRGI